MLERQTTSHWMYHHKLLLGFGDETPGKKTQGQIPTAKQMLWGRRGGTPKKKRHRATANYRARGSGVEPLASRRSIITDAEYEKDLDSLHDNDCPFQRSNKGHMALYLLRCTLGGALRKSITL